VTPPDSPAAPRSPLEERLRHLARDRFLASTEVSTAFFVANADRLALCCRDLAGAFQAGHRLFVFGEGAQRTDALHVAVEFVHPVIVGKRALPALAVQDAPAAELRVVAEPGDVALGIAAGRDSPAVREALGVARGRGMVTVALVGRDTSGWMADHVFAVDSRDLAVVQEVHEIAYHVLWELAHVFLDNPATLRMKAVPPSPDRDGSENAPVCEPHRLTGHCITCSDEGDEGVVVSIAGLGTALVAWGGEEREVAIDLIEGVRVGDRVLVHAGVAIARLEDGGA
jgi:D-sedoheptulose 7-phosphate isomerase